MIDKAMAKKCIEEFWIDEIRFCDCGSPGNTLKLIKQILNLIYKRYDKEEYVDYNYDNFKEDIHNLFQCKSSEMSMEIYYIIAYLLDSVDVLEHGSSIGGSWLSSSGKYLRECLNIFNDEEIEDLLCE